jgi:hypothetical protein
MPIRHSPPNTDWPAGASALQSTRSCKSRWSDRSINDAGQSVGPIGRQQAARLFGTRIAQTILASDQAIASNRPDIWMHAIRSHQKLLCHGGRPHMGPGSRSRALACPGRQKAFSRHVPPEFCEASPSKNQRAQGMPGARRTHCLACKQKDARRPTQVRRNHSGTPCAMVLRLIARSPRSTGLVSLRRSSIISISLTPASGGQDHAPLPSASTRIACALPRPSHPARRFVTIGRNVPHVRARWLR